eukprot:m.200083 g.200083  ORF g.200083 m.200083 type:complete len:67 (+) comp15734_c0_seq15:2982-3182(+)
MYRARVMMLRRRKRNGTKPKSTEAFYGKDKKKLFFTTAQGIDFDVDVEEEEADEYDYYHKSFANIS